jgi:Baseplate J-like protein
MSSELSSTCNCCEEIQIQDPEFNYPGLSAIAYRVGSHGSFKARMLKAISGNEALSVLTSRDDNDLSIALLDSWAAVLDVLSFYQERIANEGYLRTATERYSILELAREIGYELRRGVAASTYLVFNLETVLGSPGYAKIYSGTKAQTIPGQDEKPQIFETIEDIQAYAEWNQLKVKSSDLWKPVLDDNKVFLKGTSTNLKKGDAILIVGDERKNNIQNKNWDFAKVVSLETVVFAEAEKSYTIITINKPLGNSKLKIEPAKENPIVYTFRQRASLFGYNAPDWKAMPGEIQKNFKGEDELQNKNEWPNFNIAYSSVVPDDIDSIYLDTIYPSLSKEGWIILSNPSHQELYGIDEVSEESLTNFTLTSKTSKLKLSGENLGKIFGNSLREAVVYVQSEKLEIADRPIISSVSGDSITLDKNISGLFEKQILIITGDEEKTGELLSESAVINKIEETGGLTTLTFEASLKNIYKRASVIIYANVARATHGETKMEILGSGDASKPFQKFILKQKPLTYVSASTHEGSKTSLEVRVNDILWEEVPSFFMKTYKDRVYITRSDNDGNITVQFGDGVNGSRLPTGIENITAKYRVGIGTQGLVKKKQISLLMTHPLGVKDVSNPSAPEGAADPQDLNEARDNAPLTVLTLDRIVSIQDFENYARSFAGIGKARSSSIWNGENQIVSLTIAGVNGASVQAGSELYKNLLESIDKARHPDVQVKVDNFVLLLFNIEAKIFVDKNYDMEKVVSEVKNALIKHFSFTERSFGQAVSLSEVMSVIQVIEGVIFVDVDSLYLDSQNPSLNKRLFAGLARMQNNIIKPAELILINSSGIKLTGIIQ